MAEDKDDDLEAAYRRVVKIHRKVSKKFDSIYDKAGISPKELRAILREPQHFNDAQWKAIQEQRKKSEEELWKVLGEKARRRAERKKKKKKASKRGRKFLGGRKGWIQMD